MLSNFINFRKSGIEKVSADYINQFFTVGEIHALIEDLQLNKQSPYEIKLLEHVGLGDLVTKMISKSTLISNPFESQRFDITLRPQAKEPSDSSDAS